MLAGARSYQSPNKDTSILIPSIGKLSTDGDSLWYYSFSFRSGSNIKESFHNIIATSDGGYLSVGESILSTAENDDLPWVQSIIVKVDSNGILDTTSVSILNVDTETFSLSPNPATNVIYLKQNGDTTLDLEIIDKMGRVIDVLYSYSSIHTIICDISNYESGIYTVKARDKSKQKQYISRFIKL